MDKNIIKKYLSDKFISEAATPGISVTDKALKDSDKINKDGVNAINKDIKDYDKALKQTDKTKMPTNKFNYVNPEDKEYHDEMETLNGQEMLEYDIEPSKEFKDRAKESLVGSSRMGNKKGANAEETWNASSDNFGEKLVKRIKDSSKKRTDSELNYVRFGDDVEVTDGKKSPRKLAIENVVNENENISTSENGIQTILKFFGVSDVRDISKSKKWSNMNLFLKHNNCGDYVGYKVDRDSGLMLIGTSGIVTLKVSNDKLKPIKSGAIYK